MSSITTAVAADYRLQQWIQLVKECQNRPSDMTVEQWCDTKGISKSNYYYRLRRIRKACLEHIPNHLKPYEYFEYLLEEIPKHMDDKDLSFCEDLLPWLPNLPEKCRKTEKK